MHECVCLCISNMSRLTHMEMNTECHHSSLFIPLKEMPVTDMFLFIPVFKISLLLFKQLTYFQPPIGKAQQ